MKTASLKKPEPQPDPVFRALSLYEPKPGMQKQRTEASKELYRAERRLKQAAGDLEREKRRQANRIEGANARAAQNWHDYVKEQYEVAKEAFENLSQRITALDRQLEQFDIEPIRAEFEVLSKEGKLIGKRLRRSYYDDDDEEKAAQARLTEINGRLKLLEPALKDIKNQQMAIRHHQEVKENYPKIKAVGGRYEKAMDEAMSAFTEIRELMPVLARGVDFNIFLLAHTRHSGRKLVEIAEGEIQ